MVEILNTGLSSARTKYINKEVLYDFSVNINPLGLPINVISNVIEGLETCNKYPDLSCCELRSLLSEKYLLPKDSFFVGNGADDILYRIVYAFCPKKALIIEPTFEEYEKVLRSVSCQVEHYILPEENNFNFCESVLNYITDDLDILFLCNPNNPTGTICDLKLIHRILDKCRVNNVKLVIDECFMEFIPEWKEYSAKFFIKEYDNLIVIDAFTKTYALAGFRLGFCVCGNLKILDALNLNGQDYSVSTPAQLAGIGALTSAEYLPLTYEFVQKEREFMQGSLKRLPVKVYPSRTNFLLFFCKDSLLVEKLRHYNIKVRDCSEFYSLSNRYHRIAVSTRKNNQYFVQVLEEIMRNS
ncbi:MAG: aminotransferase class I/II-fold pyridoxal phosphate-dependent enzyme [Eubacterium sp.]|jgi:threonine-phosphate decarboxylase|nr:aminotransferase class I/II-fold pyridoxal phosphate-dependent enzyme [Eubacterium sp.]